MSLSVMLAVEGRPYRPLPPLGHATEKAAVLPLGNVLQNKDASDIQRTFVSTTRWLQAAVIYL